MNRNKLIWCFVALSVLTTVGILSGTFQNYAQQQTSKPKPTPKPKKWDLGKYAVTDYNEPEPTDPEDRDVKRSKGKRYDKMDWVQKSVHPEDSGVGFIDHTPIPPTIPIVESDLILIGEITAVTASMSNDKKGVYSEFRVNPLEIIRSDGTNKAKPRGSISVDRAGGYVRYPNGQKVLYFINGLDLPRVGARYLFFLDNKEKGHNYHIVTGYELTDSGVIPLDEVPFENFQNESVQTFLNVVRQEISKSTN